MAAAAGLGVDASVQELLRVISGFLDDDDADGTYKRKISQMMDRKERRLIVDMGDVRRYMPKLADSLSKHPGEVLPLFERSLLQIVNREDPAYLTKLAFHGVAGGDVAAADREGKVFVGFDGSFGSHLVSPRTLSSAHITHLVAVEGIVTKCSLVRPKVAKSVHYCPATKAFTEREYRDATDMTGLPTGSAYPTKDSNGNVLETEFGLSVYKDHQTFTLQEMPERAPLGQLPRSVDVVMDNDLVDKAKPGDRVQVVGVYRALAGQGANATSGVFRTVLIANSVRLLNKDSETAPLSADDVTVIRKIGKRADVVDILARSLAPSIYGHDHIKLALLLLLLGGGEKNLENGTHLRGDINILMVGDPSTAKSQMLRFVLGIAPLAVNTTGRGSSGVGLTAAVTHDPETGERRLEAGAMVLADRGVVCIDEFDKMSDVDRVAIHEVMEQQTVTIAKAGIQASLNARCSVVAAANPIYGQYDSSISPQKNVHLPDSLLSRFDLMFIVQDSMDESRDRAVADHVLRMHRFVKPGQEGIPIPLDSMGAHPDEGSDPLDAAAEADPWEKFNPLLHGGAAHAAGATTAGRKKAIELLKIAFVKKYVSYAKQRVKPELSDAARDLIVQNYSELRQKQVDGAVAMPITARSLETIIRLSTAHAKARLSKAVEESDVRSAFGLMEFALHHDATGTDKVRRKKKSKTDAGAGTSAGASEDDDSEGGEDGPSGLRHEEQPSTRPQAEDPTPIPSRVTQKPPSSSPARQSGKSGTQTSPGRGSSRAQATLAAAASAKKRSREEDASDDEREPSSDVQRKTDAAEPKRAVDRSDSTFKSFMTMIANKARLERLQSASLEKVLEWAAADRSGLKRIDVVSFLTELDAMNRVMYTGGVVHFL